MTPTRLTCNAAALGRLLACLLMIALSAPAAAAVQAQATPVASDAPVPVTFPRDDGPHDANVEWWYFTGHLFTQEGDRYGFEYVTFRARDGNLEGYVSHFAITDNPRRQFHYGPAPAGRRRGGGRRRCARSRPGWLDDARRRRAIRARGRHARLCHASRRRQRRNRPRSTTATATSTMATAPRRTTTPGRGWRSLGSSISVRAGQQVSGEAWMDHQWGDFDDLPGGRVGLVLGPARGRDGRDALSDSRCRWQDLFASMARS